MEIDGEAVAQRLRDCAQAKSLSQSEVARGTGLNAATVSRYFNAGRLPSPAELLDLARFFEVSVEWLLTGEMRDEAAMRMNQETVVYGAKKRRTLEEAAKELEEIVRKIREMDC